jgi:hypothetical protein
MNDLPKQRAPKDSLQRPQSSQIRAEVFFSAISVPSVVHLFFAARGEVERDKGDLF